MAYEKKPYSAADIGSGNVSDTEFDYLNGVTSPLQTQIDGKGPAKPNWSASNPNVRSDAESMRSKVR